MNPIPLTRVVKPGIGLASLKVAVVSREVITVGETKKSMAE
jgi:hypothetical protein